MEALIKVILARVIGNINGRDCQYVPGHVIGHDLESGFSLAGGRVVFISGLPTDENVF